LLFRPRSRERLPRRTSKLGDSISEKLTKDGYTWYEVHLESGSDNGWVAGSLIGY
jgi:hypothetical protein